jgi:hypothetical protein
LGTLGQSLLYFAAFGGFTILRVAVAAGMKIYQNHEAPQISVLSMKNIFFPVLFEFLVVYCIFMFFFVFGPFLMKN